MGRGQMSGGGTSQLNYLFGSDSHSLQSPASTSVHKGGDAKVAPATSCTLNEGAPTMGVHSSHPSVESIKDPAKNPTPESNSLSMVGESSNQNKTSVNNYHRAGGDSRHFICLVLGS